MPADLGYNLRMDNVTGPDQDPYHDWVGTAVSRDAEDAEIVDAIRGVLEVWSVRRVEPEAGRGLSLAMRRSPGGIEVRGRLRVPSDEAYAWLAPRLRGLGHVALFRKQGREDVVLAVPGALAGAGGRPTVAILLFVATFVSVLVTGAFNEQGSGEPFDLLVGLPFAVSLLGILGAHEMGHFLVARRLGLPTSPPFFIPLPLTILGTMGAVMQMKAPARNRRHLLAVACAGPLAGLVVALPVLIVGLMLSPVLRTPAGATVFQEGNSLLYAGLKLALFGRFLPSNGEDVFLHPVALAGWAGLLVTGLNLLPAGQLDGGHVAYVLLGQRARYLTWVVLLALAGLSFLWTGWLIWVALVFAFGQVHAVPLDDITPLRPGERALAGLMVLLFILVFMPIPMVIA